MAAVVEVKYELLLYLVNDEAIFCYTVFTMRR